MSLVESILDKFNIPFESLKGGKELKFNCIMPKHADRTASASINSESGLWRCMSCLDVGNLKSLVRIASKGTLKLEQLLESGDLIKFKIESVYKTSTDSILSYERELEFERVYNEEKDNFIPAEEHEDALKYLQEKRKFTLETIREFGLMFAVDGHYKDRIIIPYFLDGDIIGFNSRYIYKCGSSKRYLYSINSKKFIGYIYNHHNLLNRKYAILVEGPFDLMYMQQCGFSNCISTLNTNLSIEHIIKLMEFNSIIFCFDNDVRSQAGQKAVLRHTEMILKHDPDMNVMQAIMEGGKDPNDCTKEELKDIFRSLRKLKLKRIEEMSDCRSSIEKIKKIL